MGVVREELSIDADSLAFSRVRGGAKPRILGAMLKASKHGSWLTGDAALLVDWPHTVQRYLVAH